MQLRAWREIWMALAISACGGAPAWMRDAPPARISVFDAPPLAGVTYFAQLYHVGRKPAQLTNERGRFSCARLYALLQDDRGMDELTGANEAQKTCSAETATLLRSGSGFVFLDGGTGGKWMTGADLIAAASPIDTPAKALLAAWAQDKYDLGWGDGKRYYGGAEDGRVRAVPGGFEVAGSTRAGRGCGTPGTIERRYRLTLFVDTQGTVTVRDRVETSRDTITQQCHPLGRRPEDFIDVSCDYLSRAMHLEAESVRAFLRIARELRAHGAPDELADAAEQAARDEIDHAKRFAALLGTQASIATDTLPIRSLRELAIDNATEGCVGESYAALVATVQAETASTPELRAHFAAIAVDELAHAALAHAIADWLDTVITDDDHAAIAVARTAAFAELAASCGVADEGARTYGMPSGAEAHRLVALVATTRRPAPAA